MMKLLRQISAAEKRGGSLLYALPDPVTGEKSPFKEPVWSAAAMYAVLGAAWLWCVKDELFAPSISRAETTEDALLQRWDTDVSPDKKSAVLGLAQASLDILTPSPRLENESVEEYSARVAEEERKGQRGLSKSTLRKAVSSFERKANEILPAEAATDATDEFIGQILEYLTERSEGAESPAKRALYQTLGNELLFGRWYGEMVKAAESAAKDAKKLKIAGASEDLAQEILQTGSVRALRDMPQILKSARANKTSVLQGIKESLIQDVYGARKEATGDIEKTGGIVGATPGYEVVVKGPAQIAYERGGIVEMAKASKIEDVLEEVGSQPFMWTRDGKQFLVLRKNETLPIEAVKDVRAGRKLKVSKDDPRYPRVAVQRSVTSFYAVDPDEWKKAQARAPKGAKDDVVLEFYKQSVSETEVPEELEKLLKKMKKERVLKRIPIEPESERNYTQAQLQRLDRAVTDIAPTAIVRRVKADDDEGESEAALAREVEAGGTESDLGRAQLAALEESLESSEFVSEVSRRLSGERAAIAKPLREVLKSVPELASLVAEGKGETSDRDLEKIRTVVGKLEQGDFSAIDKKVLKKYVEDVQQGILRDVAKGKLPPSIRKREALEMAEAHVAKKLPRQISTLVNSVSYELDNRKVLKNLEQELAFVDPRRARTGRGLTYAQMLDLEISRERLPPGSLQSGAFLRKLDKWRVARRPDESAEAYEARRKRAAMRVKTEEEPSLGVAILKDAELLVRARDKVNKDLEQVYELERLIKASGDPEVAAMLPKVSSLRKQIGAMYKAIAPRIPADDEAIAKLRALQRKIGEVEIKSEAFPEGSPERQRLEFVLDEMNERLDRLSVNPEAVLLAKDLNDREDHQREVERLRGEAVSAAREWERAYEADLASKFPVTFDSKIETEYGPMVLRQNRARLLRDLASRKAKLQRGPFASEELYKTMERLDKLQDYVPPRFSLQEQSERTRQARDRFLQITGQVGETMATRMPKFVRRALGRDPEQIQSPTDVLGQSLGLVDATREDQEIAVRDIASTLDEYLGSRKNLKNLDGELDSLNVKISNYAQRHEGNPPEGREEALELVTGKKKWRGRSAARVISPEGGAGFGEIQKPIDYWLRYYTYQNEIAEAERQNERAAERLQKLGVRLDDPSQLQDAYGRIASAKTTRDKDAAVEFFAQTPALAKAVFLMAERRAAARKGQ